MFTKSNQNYVGILKNMNFVLNEATTKDIVKIRDNLTVGDWRDSQHGLAFGSYPISVNVGHVPSALKSIIDLLQNSYFDKADIGAVADQLGLKYLKQAVNDI